MLRGVRGFELRGVVALAVAERASAAASRSYAASSSVSCGGTYVYDIEVSISGTSLAFYDNYCGTITHTDSAAWDNLPDFVAQ